jgi:hypothetical protein
MTCNIAKGLALAVGAWLILGAAGSVRAEDAVAPNVKVEEVKVGFESITRGANVGSLPVERMLQEQWVKVTVRFSTLKPFTDEITVRVSMDGVEEEGKEGFVVLTSQITFVNVPAGQNQNATFYLYPTAAVRYGGKGGRGFNKSNVYVEATAAGEEPAIKFLNEKEPNKDWPTQGRQVPNVLVPVNESPWWPFEANNYNQIKR